MYVHGGRGGHARVHQNMHVCMHTVCAHTNGRELIHGCFGVDPRVLWSWWSPITAQCLLWVAGAAHYAPEPGRTGCIGRMQDLGLDHSCVQCQERRAVLTDPRAQRGTHMCTERHAHAKGLTSRLISAAAMRAVAWHAGPAVCRAALRAAASTASGRHSSYDRSQGWVQLHVCMYVCMGTKAHERLHAIYIIASTEASSCMKGGAMLP